MKRITVASVGLLVMWGCLRAHRPPEPTAPRTPVPVSASKGRTWDAALAAFAERNIKVNTDKISGIIASNAIGLSNADTGGRDCGTSPEGKTLRPDVVRYQVAVKGDSTAATIVVKAGYGRLEFTALQECGSLGTWEAAFEADVKRRAEQP